MQTDLRGWLRDVSDIVDRSDSPYHSLMEVARGAFNGLYFTVTTRYPIGTNIYERDWDLLIVLDACRVDALREVAPEYEFIESVGSIWSVGSSSHEWLSKTFTEQYRADINETVAVTTNPFVPKTFEERIFPPQTYNIPVMAADWNVVDNSAFEDLLHVDKHDYEDYFAAPPPDIVTDYAIDLARRSDPSRMVIHYLQPHIPFIADAYREEREPTDVERDPWTAMQTGAATREDVWDLYLDNLRLVLDCIQRLVRNTDAEKVVLTADHGNLFGELGAYGHPEGLPHPNLKKVPWATATATDTGNYQPEVSMSRQRSTDTEAVTEQLEQLGYL